jgi:hypothetical protein
MDEIPSQNWRPVIIGAEMINDGEIIVFTSTKELKQYLQTVNNFLK